ncbi:MAG TPA: hypothetical protein VGM39_03160 [Kofleriaceae bacterium]
MSLLSDLESQRVPRSDEVAAAAGTKIMAAYKFVLLGILWLSTVADILALIFMFGTIGLMRLAGTHKGDSVESILGLVAFGVSQIVAWTWFARIVRTRRERAVTIGREGHLVDAVLYKQRFHRDGRYIWRWNVEIDGKAYWDYGTFIGISADAPDRRSVKLLALPGERYGLLFASPDGCATRLRVDPAGQRVLDAASEETK